MRIWLITAGELLPTDGNIRLFRYGILANFLAEQQEHHDIIRWAPTFVHATKRQRFGEDTEIRVNKRYKINFLYTPDYKNHIGVKRYLFHRKFAQRFSRNASLEKKPDIILCSMPIPELCIESIIYGIKHNVPVIIDVRDVWPDALLHSFPIFLRRLIKISLFPFKRKNKFIFKYATGIIGITDGFLQWGLNHAKRDRGMFDSVFYMAYPRTKFSIDETREAKTKWDARRVGIKQNKMRVCFFGSFVKLFDIEIIIKVAKQLHKRKINNFQFIICGDGPNYLKILEMSDDVPSILLPGWVTAPEVEVLMERSAIGIIPYKRGVVTALPNKAVTYFSKGLPVITSNEGEFSEIVTNRHCGVTYKVEDVDSLIEVLLALYNNKKMIQELSEGVNFLYENELNSDLVYGNMLKFLLKISKYKD
ncbi:MAG: glycosyltransferase [Candidatus Electrothrix sp. AR3]|nr:glycosyltransferase [Candidatus Electrothrix sp. AR3]